jgi:uncharacterized membrane protein
VCSGWKWFYFNLNEFDFRGALRSLWVGVLIALPSGAGVALSVLGGNAGSLVGVAISASLLPPAVNAVSSVILRCLIVRKCWKFKLMARS